MRHLSAIPLLSTAMIAVLMLSISILIACGGGAPDIGPVTEPPPESEASPVTGPSVVPVPLAQPLPETESQPGTPATSAATRETEAPTDSLREPELPPDLARETPGATRMEESKPETYPKTTPVPLATLAPRSERGDRDMHSTTTKDSAEAYSSQPPATREHGGRSSESGKHGSRPIQRQADLKAGEVDDNQRWNEYLQFVADYDGPQVHRTSLADRQIIIVLDRDGNPVPNALVTVSDNGKNLAEYLTYADGRTLLFPDAIQGRPTSRSGERDQLDISVERDGFTAKKSIILGEAATHAITLDGKMTYGSSVPLDVLFLLDSTGSMDDEIQQIKATLQSIAKRVSNLPANPDLRFGMVSYRDQEDRYITQLHDFDGNVERFQQTIRGVEASGGGDYPESLNQALHEAVNDASWRENSIRLTFLIADAPPHLDYQQDEDYAAEMVRAREKGIKIFSVASSGLDEQGEYIFRQIAQQTMGNFLFILYRDGPQGKLDTPHSVEQFTVNNLDGLIVRLIEMELAGIKGGQKPGMRMK